MRWLNCRFEWSDSSGLLCTRHVFGHTSNRICGDLWLSVEHHRLWHRGVFGEVKHQESLNVQKVGLFYFVGSNDFFRHLRVFVVFCAGPRAGNLHGDLDSLNLLLRNLLQAGHIAREKKMMPTDLLFLGALVFVLMLIGLGLIVIEFRNKE